MPSVDGKRNICKLSKHLNTRSMSKQAIGRYDNNDIAQLYVEYYVYIKHFIVSHIGFITDVDDLTQDVFTKLYEARIPPNNDNFKGYLFGIARNIIRKYIREKQKKTINIISIDSMKNIEIHPSITQDHEKDGTYYKQKLRTTLIELKYKLPPKMYKTVVLNFFEKLSPEQAANKIGCSMQAYKKRLQRAARIMEQIIKQSND